jgi:hypothetical protein
MRGAAGVAALGLLLGFAGAVSGVACASSPDTSATVNVAALDEAAYQGFVHAVVEKTCGASDCHGTAPRGLRVYGATALRLSGATGPTTPDEIRATYVSILGLEPENLNDFTSAQPRSEEAAYKLLLLAKPLAIERHRGGISLRKGEPAEQCILSWLMARTDPAACSR